ncbi:MAG: hypothetical protein C0599_04000, partial [Salinivirgaceae bacterium]
MRQKIIIGFSVLLLLLAVVLISYDLFHESPRQTAPNVLTKQTNALKDIDPSLVAYNQIQTIEVGIKSPKGIAVDDNKIFVCGENQVIIYSTSGTEISVFTIDSSANCIEVRNNKIYLGTGSDVASYASDGQFVGLFESMSDKGLITSIATDSDFIYVADAINKTVLKYSYEGKLEGEIGGRDSLQRKKGFVIPSPYFDVVAGGFSDIWAANTGYLRFENFSS